MLTVVLQNVKYLFHF